MEAHAGDHLTQTARSGKSYFFFYLQYTFFTNARLTNILYAPHSNPSKGEFYLLVLITFVCD